MISTAVAGGPMNRTPASAQAAANAVFSDKETVARMNGIGARLLRRLKNGRPR
jgi:hypothetical protein